MNFFVTIWTSYLLFGERNINLAPHNFKNGIDYWRAKLFSRIILFTIPVGTVAYAAGCIMAVLGNIPVVAVADTIVYLSFILVVGNRNIPLHTRKIVFLVLTYLLSFVLILFIGFRGPGLLFLMMTSVFALLLFNSKSGYLTLFFNVSLLVLLQVGLLFDFSKVAFFTEYSFGSWLAIGSSFLLLNAVLVYSISSLINDLERNLKNEQKLKGKIKTESKKLRIEKEKAIKSTKMKSAFLANMSHEIRTPLNSIVGFANILKSNHTPENQKLYIDVINKSSEQLLSLINDIINFSKIEAGAIQIENKEIKLSGFLTTIAAAMKAICPPNLRFIYKFDINKSEELVYIDDQKLTQVLTNLITNAFKYTLTGTVEFKAFLSKKNTLEFMVRDTGIGIPREMHQDVFERFFQQNSTSDGVGLGLSISNALIKALNGNLHFESETGKGTTFFVSIPYQTTRQNSIPDSDAYNSFSISDIGINGFRKIIVAEDNDENFEIIKELFSCPEVSVQRARTGKEAVELIKDNEFDLVFMDIKMPVLDGFEATRQIRAFNRQIPIIALTAFAFESDKKKAIHVGCSDFISKPIDFQELNNVLSRLSKERNN